MADLKKRLERMTVAYDLDGKSVTAKDIGAVGAMAALLKDAIRPNLIQTLENTPAIVHGGPFANIAHGCNSVRATKAALKLADYCITEAGFGADLGAEKFFDIKCRQSGLKPDAVVLVATIRALKYNGGVKKEDLSKEDIEALKKGSENLAAHIENLKKFKVPVHVALNAFVTDTQAETRYIETLCKNLGCSMSLSRAWELGGEGALPVAEALIDILEHEKSGFTMLYEDDLDIASKIKKVAVQIYGADGAAFSKKALTKIKRYESEGYSKLPVCIAKTQYSFSDDPSLLGRPKDFVINVKDVYVSSGAGFIVVLTGDIMTMPGLPKVPAANSIDVDENGMITGLF